MDPFPHFRQGVCRHRSFLTLQSDEHWRLSHLGSNKRAAPHSHRHSSVMLVRWVRGRPVFTDRDWLFLFGHSRKEVFSLRLLLRFVALWLAVVIIGFAISFYVLPYGIGWFAGAVVVAITGILPVVPRCLC